MRPTANLLPALLLCAIGGAACAEPARAWGLPGASAGQEITGPDGNTYVWVPPGEFMMGSEAGYGGAQRPVHLVRITRGFWIGKYEVTNARYRSYCQATGRTFPPNSYQVANHPVVYASWEDALAYCRHYGMTLPTEAQWEYAARGPDSRRYPWGDEWDPARCCHYGRRGRGGWSCPVGSFPGGASWCGARDMAGNVYEWCLDFYDEDYYRASPTDDPAGPETGSERAVRGGAWMSDPYQCRPAVRSGDVPERTISYDGFRCLIVPSR